MPSDDIRFPRPSPPARAQVLSVWIDRYAKQAGVTADRVRRLLAFEFVLAAFEQTSGGDPQVVIKGGVAMELRLRLRGRATKDVDAMLRRPAEAEEIEDVVRDAMSVRLLDGAVSFEVRSAHEIGTTGAVRFDVRVFWKGQSLARTKLEVSAAEGRAGESWEAVEALNLASQFGISSGIVRDIPCLPLRFQIAQKIHAVTAPHEDNDRFRDLLDLLLLDELDERDPDGVLREACLEVFAERGEHAWPPRVTARSGWSAGYRAMAERMPFPLKELEPARAAVQTMIDRIDSAAAAITTESDLPAT